MGSAGGWLQPSLECVATPSSEVVRADERAGEVQECFSMPVDNKLPVRNKGTSTSLPITAIF